MSEQSDTYRERGWLKPEYELRAAHYFVIDRQAMRQRSLCGQAFTFRIDLLRLRKPSFVCLRCASLLAKSRKGK